MADADWMWKQRSWGHGWMEPPSCAAALIRRPDLHQDGTFDGMSFTRAGMRVFRWAVRRHWAYWRWQLLDGRWLHARMATNTLARTDPGFIVLAEESPERLPQLLPLARLEAQLRKAGPTEPKGVPSPKGPAGPAQLEFALAPAQPVRRASGRVAVPAARAMHTKPSRSPMPLRT